MQILLIEDDEEIASFLKPKLMEESFVVDVAEDGEKGLDMALANYYDLIILDNVLPKKNGQEICGEIRKNGKAVPILVLSVKSEIETKTTMLDTGADDYITKPFLYGELLARVKMLLRRTSQV